MRWKLLIITSIVAALLSAGAIRTLVYLTEGEQRPLSAQPGLAAGILAVLLLFSTLATIFIYRHTARRRKLQAALTALLSIILTFATLFIIAQILPERPIVEVRPLTTNAPHGPA